MEHVLRAVCQISGNDQPLVLGSQSILGIYADDALPPEAVSSIEVDIAFLDDKDDQLADRIDGAIGELSAFHEKFGYYAHGVSVSSAVLPVPAGWRERLVVFESAETDPGRGLCLEPHDLVVSQLVAFRDKDRDFAAALIRAGLVYPDILSERIALLEIHPAIKKRLRDWLRHAI